MFAYNGVIDIFPNSLFLVIMCSGDFLFACEPSQPNVSKRVLTHFTASPPGPCKSSKTLIKPCKTSGFGSSIKGIGSRRRLKQFKVCASNVALREAYENYRETLGKLLVYGVRWGSSRTVKTHKMTGLAVLDHAYINLRTRCIFIPFPILNFEHTALRGMPILCLLPYVQSGS